MSEFRFHKRICTNRHASPVVPVTQPLPKKCPECGEPYNNRNHPPLLCDEEGNLQSEVRNAAPAEPDSRPEAVPSAQERGVALGRRDTAAQTGRVPGKTEETVRTGRVPVQRGRETASAPPGESAGTRCLRCGGVSLSVPAAGAVLGRGGLGAELLALNPLVSREHAYVRADQTGDVLVKDLGSLNGTCVDTGEGRVRLEARKPVLLRLGNRLWLADQMFVVEEA